MELDLVQTLLDLYWRKRRLRCYEQIKLQKRLDEIRVSNEHSCDVENLRSWIDEFRKDNSISEVDAILKTLYPLYSNTISLR